MAAAALLVMKKDASGRIVKVLESRNQGLIESVAESVFAERIQRAYGETGKLDEGLLREAQVEHERAMELLRS